MVGKHASISLIGPDTGPWVSWMMSNVVEITPWQVHTFPLFTSTDDGLCDPKNPSMMLYRNLRISMVPDMRQPEYVTCTVLKRVLY